MTKEELKEQLFNLLFTKGYTINRQCEYGMPFWFSVIGTSITLELPNERERRAFASLINENETERPCLNSLSYEDSLEMLFLHYPFSYTNDSNCVLVNWKKEVLWIQWNGLKNTVFLKNSSILTHPWYIVINNSKKLSVTLKQSDIWKISNWLNTLIKK